MADIGCFNMEGRGVNSAECCVYLVGEEDCGKQGG